MTGLVVWAHAPGSRATEQFCVLRRHFFLAFALALLVVMLIAAGLKLAWPKGTSPSGSAKPGAEAGGGRGGRPAMVSVVTIASRSFADTIAVLGVAKGRQSVTLTAAATQLVSRVRFTDGQVVRQGDVLVELKDNEQDAALAQAEARLIQAQRDFDRWKALGAQGYASKSAIDQREASFLSAKADVDVARSRQGDRVIRAPFSGVVGLSDIAPGALINPGAAIVTLDDTSAVRVDFKVPDRYLASLFEGQAILATTDAYPGLTVRGTLAKLDSRVDERSRAITARAIFPNLDRRLKPGMMMRVGISRGQRTSLAAPESAISVQNASAFVFVVAHKGTKTVAEQRVVSTGVRQEGYVEILDGVEAGDKIVADGLNKVQPGQALKVVGAAGPGGRPTSGGRPGA